MFFYLDAFKSQIKKIQDKFRYQILLRVKLSHADEIENEVFTKVNELVKGNVFIEINPQNLS